MTDKLRIVERRNGNHSLVSEGDSGVVHVMLRVIEPLPLDADVLNAKMMAEMVGLNSDDIFDEDDLAYTLFSDDEG